jgi:hypothetical protein
VHPQGITWHGKEWSSSSEESKMVEAEREITPNPDTLEVEPRNIGAMPEAEGASFKIRATWSNGKDLHTGFLQRAVGGALAYKWYMQADASEKEAARFFKAGAADDGTSYYCDVESGYWLSQAASPRLWLYLSSGGYATRWSRDASGRLVSAYDNGNPVYLCIKQPNIVSDAVGFLCSGNGLDDHYALLNVEFIES